MAVPPRRELPQEQKDLLCILGYLYQQHGRSSHAAILFAALHALDPEDTFVARSLAHAFIGSGQPEDALAILDALLDRGDTAALTHVLRSQALVQCGRLPEAARAMRFYLAVCVATGNLERI